VISFHRIRKPGGRMLPAALPALAAFTIGLLAFSAPAFAETIKVDLADNFGLTDHVVQIVALITVLSLAPSIFIMVTSFVRIIVVLSLLRTAIGMQQSPPNSVLISLALFLTAFVMTPTFTAAYENGIQPLMEKRSSLARHSRNRANPSRAHALAGRKQDLKLFVDLSKADEAEEAKDLPLQVIVPPSCE